MFLKILPGSPFSGAQRPAFQRVIRLWITCGQIIYIAVRIYQEEKKSAGKNDFHAFVK